MVVVLVVAVVVAAHLSDDFTPFLSPSGVAFALATMARAAPWKRGRWVATWREYRKRQDGGGLVGGFITKIPPRHGHTW